MVFLLALILLTGCASRFTVSDVLSKIFVVNSPPIAAVTSAPTEIQTPIPTAFPTAAPTPTATPDLPKVYELPRQNIRAVMESYGFVEEYYLTDAYWERLYQRIDEFGAAKKISAFELHGNNYSMYDGSYAMNPGAFYAQVEYMMKNEYHFVTIHELRGFLEGWLDLPKRSIIMTTDSGYGSQESFKSIIGQFSELENKFGYKPHLQSYIWTGGMGAEESTVCKDNACWDSFINAKASGYFTFGTHSQSHARFEFQDAHFLREDLTLSKQKILENTCVNVYAITWPFESCSWQSDALREIGISFGFGGFSKSGSDLFVRKADGMVNCLPRIFLPNPSGYSSRPYGFTLKDILESQEH